MADSAAFKDTQYAFAAHIRDPENVPAPEGIEERRMAIYRQLFFNNLKSLLSTTYPVLRKLHSEERWRQMIREFMQKHRAKTPYFPELPSEFLAFLENEYEAKDDDFPFLVELAHYEYIELALSVSDIENDSDDADPDGDLLGGIPVKSALAWLYAYRFPVHRIAPDFTPDEPSEQPHYLAVVRDLEDRVQFHELNPVTAALFNAIDNNENKTGQELLFELATEFNMPDTDQFVGHGAAALEQFRQNNIIIGARAPTRR